MSEPTVDRGPAVRAVTAYGLARIGLIILLSVVIHAAVVLIGAPVPLIFSILLATFIALPLSMLIFTGFRTRATEALAELAAQRQAQKNWVQRELAERG